MQIYSLKTKEMTLGSQQYLREESAAIDNSRHTLGNCFCFQSVWSLYFRCLRWETHFEYILCKTVKQLKRAGLP